MILVDMVTSWIDRKAINRAASTISGYRRLCRLYIAPTEPGQKIVGELDESHMIALLRPLLDRGCTRQAQLLQILLTAVFKDAVRRRVMDRSPMDGLDHIRHRSRLTPWLTVDQARRLLETSESMNDPCFVAWLLMLCCGLRRGEMLGVRWDDIDFSRQILHISRQKVRVEGQILVTKPKSVASVRDIPLDDHLTAKLRLLRHGDGVILDVSDKQLQEALDRALIAADVPRVTLHGLRHTMAATAASDGIPIKVLQGLMGHAHYQTTADIYAHVDQQPRRDAAVLIAKTLIGARLEIA